MAFVAAVYRTLRSRHLRLGVPSGLNDSQEPTRDGVLDYHLNGLPSPPCATMRMIWMSKSKPSTSSAIFTAMAGNGMPSDAQTKTTTYAVPTMMHNPINVQRIASAIRTMVFLSN